MANVYVAASATWNGKALKKAKKELSAFEQSTKALNKTLARTFATGAILAFAKKSINAFSNDEKAAKSLAVQLENTGNAFRISEVEDYIASLQSLYGVLDDQLRPAFQTLLNATGSVTLSQKALETALNVSAGTGKDLESVVAAIAKGATGTTTALLRLGTGLDKATIASGDMNKIMTALDKKFSGQAQARLETYAGKMDLLKVASANAQEIIGKGLLDALSALGKDNSIDDAANSMNNFANAIANTAKGMGELIGQVKKIIDSDVGKFLLAITALLTLGKKQLILGTASLIAYDIGKTPKSTSNFSYGAGNPRADLILSKNLTKARKDEYAIITAKNKAQSELDKLKEKFDLERINLQVALNAATDEETKLRIKAQLAILDNNEALAKKYNAELNAKLAADNLADAANKAAVALTNSASKYDEIFNNLIAYNKSLGIDQGAAAGLASMSARLQAQADAFFASMAASGGSTQMPSQVAATNTATAQAVAPVTVNVNVEGSVLTEQELTRTIQDRILVSTKYGNKYLPAGYID